jgi:hypothetical protein
MWLTSKIIVDTKLSSNQITMYVAPFSHNVAIRKTWLLIEYLEWPMFQRKLTMFGTLFWSPLTNSRVP